MDISNLLNQTLAAINQNLSLDDLSYASLLSDTWKERAKSCRTSLHTCLNFKNKYLQFLALVKVNSHNPIIFYLFLLKQHE